jgi:uncharacterized protein with FMN-binding domain
MCTSMTNRSYQEVLFSNYKGCKSKKETVFLKDDEKERVEELSSVDDVSALLIRFSLDCDGVKKYAYVDSHIVRTMNETILIEVEDNKISKIDIVNFLEPQEYIPSQRWLKQFMKKELNNNLALSNGIDAISGATLSAVAVTNASRKILAVDKVLKKNTPQKIVKNEKK